MATQRDKEKRKARMVTADRRLAEHTTEGGRLAFKLPPGIPVFTPKKDTSHNIDMVPWDVGEGNPYANSGDLYYERTYFTHPYMGPGNQTFICAAQTFKKPCACCDYRNKVSGENPDPSAAVKKLIRSLMPKERQLWLVYDRDDSNCKTVKVWEISFHNFGTYLDDKIQRAKNDKSDPDGIKFARLKKFADPVNGRTLCVGSSSKTIEGGKPFLVFPDIEFRKRIEPIPDEILESAFCVDNLITMPDYKKVKEVLHQAAPDDDEENTGADETEETETEEEEEEEEVTATFAKGDEVGFEYKGKAITGSIVKVDKKNGLYHIDSEERDKPYILKFDDATLEATEAEEEVEEEDTWVSLPPKKKPGKKKPPVEEEEEEEAEEEEEEAPPPKKKPATGKKKPAPAEDDEDWGEDEEAEEEKPKAKKPGGKKKPVADEDEEEAFEEDDD